MVDKVKSLNWALYNKIALLLANIAVVIAIANVALNTKRLEDSTIISYYLMIGVVTFILLKLNNAAITQLPE
jgi:hypothetical protein